MLEVVGTLVGFDKDAIWILDDDNDVIEMSLDRMPHELAEALVRHASKLQWQRVSYYYDRRVNATLPWAEGMTFTGLQPLTPRPKPHGCVVLDSYARPA